MKAKIISCVSKCVCGNHRLVVLKNTVIELLFVLFFVILICDKSCLRSLASDSTGQLNVFGHDGDALGVDGAEVGVLEETHQVRLGGLLKR